VRKMVQANYKEANQAASLCNAVQLCQWSLGLRVYQKVAKSKMINFCETQGKSVTVLLSRTVRLSSASAAD